MKVIFISVILIFLFSVCAEGSDWESIGNDVTGNKWYIDKESIKHPSKNIVRAWIKCMLKENLEFYSENIESAMFYTEHDCKESKYKYLQYAFYYTDGTNYSIKGLEEWNYVRPDTIEERFHKYLYKDR